MVCDRPFQFFVFSLGSAASRQWRIGDLHPPNVNHTGYAIYIPQPLRPGYFRTVPAANSDDLQWAKTFIATSVHGWTGWERDIIMNHRSAHSSIEVLEK